MIYFIFLLVTGATSYKSEFPTLKNKVINWYHLPMPEKNLPLHGMFFVTGKVVPISKFSLESGSYTKINIRLNVELACRSLAWYFFT
jgi:hypothetical protein